MTREGDKIDDKKINKLLVLCLAKNGDPSDITKRLREFSEPELKALFQQSLNHRVTPLLYLKLKPLMSLTGASGRFEVQLREAYLRSAARNMKLYAELSKVLSALKNAEIPVILLKGAYLAQFVYRNIALRPMGDVDLLVRKDDLRKTSKLLISMGFNPEGHLNVEDTCRINQHLTPFTKPGAPHLEIHWTLSTPRDSFHVDLEGVWERAQKISAHGVECLTLSPEDLLLHLCLHLAGHHGFARGQKGLCDIAQVVDRFGGRLDWAMLGKRAVVWDAGRCVYVSLLMAKNLLEASIPEIVLRELNPDNFETEEILNISRELLFSHGAPAPENLMKLWGPYGTADKLSTLMRRIFPTKTEIAVMYPVSSSSLRVYLCYPLRIGDLLRRHGSNAKRLLLKNEDALDMAQIENKRSQLKDWLKGAKVS